MPRRALTLALPLPRGYACECTCRGPPSPHIIVAYRNAQWGADYCRGTLTRRRGHRSPLHAPAIYPLHRPLPPLPDYCRFMHAGAGLLLYLLPVHAQGGLRGECMHAGAGPLLLYGPYGF